jgi:alpha-ketoglutarate-dependent taurine dioxygenase
MDLFAELSAKGWVRVKNIPTSTELFNLAKLVGTPIPCPTGEVVKKIPITASQNARNGTLSAVYGSKEFPLHTDTAFWPLPARYVVLRVQGDTRRQTKIRSFRDLWRECDRRALALSQESVWLVRTPSASVYRSMKLRVDHLGWRYDSNCMYPANDAAQELNKILNHEIAECSESIDWSDNEAVVLSNWNVLHGRGGAPPDEGARVVERVYVR